MSCNSVEAFNFCIGPVEVFNCRFGPPRVHLIWSRYKDRLLSMSNFLHDSLVLFWQCKKYCCLQTVEMSSLLLSGNVIGIVKKKRRTKVYPSGTPYLMSAKFYYVPFTFTSCFLLFRYSYHFKLSAKNVMVDGSERFLRIYNYHAGVFKVYVVRRIHKASIDDIVCFSWCYGQQCIC